MNIIKVFPKLKLFTNNNYYYLTLNELTLEDINDNINIAKLLLFDCDNNFDDLDYTKEITNYIISIYLKDTSDPITIITYTRSFGNSIKDFMNCVGTSTPSLSGPDDVRTGYFAKFTSISRP